MATSGEKDRKDAERKAQEAAEQGVPAPPKAPHIEPGGPSGYTEPRPEQKSGEGQDLGQQQTETLNEADWNQRKGSEADEK